MTVASLAFHSELDARFIGDNEWRLLSDFKAKVFHREGDEEWLIVPEGFEWDGASVPRVPFAYMLFGGRARRSALLHDFLYSQRRDRDFADAVFLAAMRHEENAFTRAFMHAGVRIGGWVAYLNKPKDDSPWRED
jgi:hypothetical protein